MNRVIGSFGETGEYLFQTTPVLSGPPRLGSGNEPERTAEIETTALPLLGVLLGKYGACRVDSGYGIAFFLVPVSFTPTGKMSDEFLRCNTF